MKLRWKALMAVGTAFAGVLLISQIILYYPMINNILAIEQSESLKQAHRVADMIAHELANLNATTVDYAAWDDTYEFVQNGNPEYITNNMLDEIFINLRLNLILFTNTSKQVVYGKAFDLENSTETAFSQSLLQHLAENDALLTHENETSTITGIINLPEGPLLVASSAITTSLHQGPVQGALLTGRFLDTVEISRLYELVHLPIVVQAIGDSWVSTDLQTANSSLSREQPYFSNPLDDKNVAGYALINDVYGNPALILRVTMPRDIYAQGITNITYHAVALFVVGVTFCVVSIAYLEKSVLSRLSRLRKEVERIEKSGDLKAQVSLAGEDELADLAHKINEMLSAIQKAEQSLRESETRLRQITENMFDMVSMADTAGICIYASPSITKTLGYKPADLLGKPLIRFVHPDDVNRLNEAFRKALESESLPKIEYRYKHLDGHYLWLEAVGNIIYDGGSEPIGFVLSARDVTERKQMEDKLRESEEKFRGIAERSFDAIAIVNHEGKITYACPSVGKVLGYPQSEVVGKSFLEFFSKADLSTGMQLFADLIKGKHFEGLQVELPRKDGTTATLEINAAPIIKEGEVVGIQAVFRDITERKRMEQKLRESEERLRQLIELAPDAIYTNSLTGVFLDGNKQAECITGYNKEELVGKSMMEVGLLPEEYVPKALEMTKKNLEGQKAGPEEFELIRKDGTRVWVEISALPIKIGEKTEILGIARNITERKKIETELQQTARQLQILLETATEGIVTADENENITFINKAFCEMTGYTEEELCGANVGVLLDEQGRKKIAEETKQRKKGVTSRYELTIYRKDGEPRIVQLSASPLWKENGEYAGSLGIITDITERKQMEQKLQEYSQQLEALVEKRTKQLREAQEQLLKAERLAAIGQVAAMVGHDLRNPLTGIKGATYYLKTKDPLKTDPKTAEMLELIEKEVMYANKIITDLLEYSREIHLELTETTPKLIVGETLSLIETPSNIQLVNQTEDEPKISVDIEKMHRVFVNLIKNAFDAMPNGGKLTITSRKINGHVELSFIDTGVGMTSEQMEKIWTPFYTTKAKGMGLGLPICKRIVEAHHGRIAVESTVGVGTTFTITLPAELAKEKEKGGEKIWVNVPESLSLTTMKASEKS